MATIGNTFQNQVFTPVIDYFSGNGATTSFTLSRPVASVAQMIVHVANVAQNPNSAYTVSGNTITFTGTPPAGTNNIWVAYNTAVTQIMQPGQGTIGAQQLDVIGAGTGAAQLPYGTTAQRPSSPFVGYTRFNTTLSVTEVYDGTQWSVIGDQTILYSVSILVVAGGGAGGAATGSLRGGGGGGAGGMVQTTATFTIGQTYSVVVGAGAASNGTLGASGTSGSNSSFGALATAYGGGGGGCGVNGISGGSGGGGGDTSGATSGGSGTAGQGNRGGNAPGSGGNGGGGAGGGGAGSAGVDAAQGSGGSGVAATINGVTYAAGGTGGSRSSGETGAAGGANTGNGGGAGGGSSGLGGAGGSGVVIIKYAGTQKGTGGTVSSSGGYTYHTFSTSGTFTFTA